MTCRALHRLVESRREELWEWWYGFTRLVHPIIKWLGRLDYSVMQSYGNSLKSDTFREAITSELMTNLNSENSYSSVFVSSKSYFLFKICLKVWFISCRLMNHTLGLWTVPIWLHQNICNIIPRTMYIAHFIGDTTIPPLTGHLYYPASLYRVTSYTYGRVFLVPF